MLQEDDINYDPEDEVLTEQDEQDIEISVSNVDDYRQGEEGWYDR